MDLCSPTPVLLMAQPGCLPYPLPAGKEVPALHHLSPRILSISRASFIALSRICRFPIIFSSDSRKGRHPTKGRNNRVMSSTCHHQTRHPEHPSAWTPVRHVPKGRREEKEAQSTLGSPDAPPTDAQLGSQVAKGLCVWVLPAAHPSHKQGRVLLKTLVNKKETLWHPWAQIPAQ